MSPSRPVKLMKSQKKSTPRVGGKSTVKLADDHFQKLALDRLDDRFKELGIKPQYTFKVTVPFKVRAEGMIRRALYRRRRGRTLEPETAGVIRAEVQRLFEERTDPGHAVSKLKASEQFWIHLKPRERYAKYRVVLKDHKKTIEACLELL
jgi:hypothetical protein